MTENNFQIDSAAISDRGLSEKRPQNEDSYLELKEKGLFVVADGVGGAQAGDVASQMAVEILEEAFANLRKGGDAEEMMKIAVERANEAIYQMSHDLAQLSTMATTIVALQVSGNIATIGHVGDSRIYRLDAKGNLYRETQDHSVVEEEVRAGRMTAAQAENHPSRNVISRALGADLTVEVDMKTIMFEPETTFLLCSDGITRHIKDIELRELLLSGDSPASITLKMKQICYERGAEDNLTAVVVRVTNSLAGNFVQKKKEAVVEYEEPTITTARSFEDRSADKNEIPTEQIQNRRSYLNEKISDEETPTGELQAPKQLENLHKEPTTEIYSNASETSASKSVASESSISTEIAPAKNPEDPKQAAEIKTETRLEDDIKSYRIDEGSSGILSKILSSLLLLIFGGLLGAGLYYFFEQRNKPVETPVLTQMQTPNILYTAFEDNRRNVDRNPKQYISANGSVVPDDAEGLYLLGRAYLLEGQYPESKQMFLRARDQLAQVKEINSKTLENEIIMGLAVVNNPFAQKEFQKEINPDKTGFNSPVNTGANNNQAQNSPNNNSQMP